MHLLPCSLRILVWLLLLINLQINPAKISYLGKMRLALWIHIVMETLSLEWLFLRWDYFICSGMPFIWQGLKFFCIHFNCIIYPNFLTHCILLLSQLRQHVLRTCLHAFILLTNLTLRYVLLTWLAKVLAARLFRQELVHFETVLLAEIRNSTLIQGHVHLRNLTLILGNLHLLALHRLDGLWDLAINDFLRVIL